jgi:SPASM domain peptide maturase of grasp-with-spasm system
MYIKDLSPKNIRDNEFLILFPNCILTKGDKHVLIQDLQRNQIYQIDLETFHFLEKCRETPLLLVLSEQKVGLNNILELVNFLIEDELAFLSSDPQCFKELSDEWDEPYTITNAIIDINQTNEFQKTFFEQIGDLGCHTVQIRIFDFYNFLEIEKYISILNNLNVSSIEILTPWHDEYTLEYFSNLCNKHKKISICTLYNSPEESIIHSRKNDFGKIIMSSNRIENIKSCGQISSSFFTINIKTFTEAHHHNSCLNRKISIDTEGNIKNCPSMKESFGNIRDTTLCEAIDKPGFKKYWDINKDKILVCKECEFRYICTDCRAYVENPEDILSKPLKCGYNPYTGEWSEWSTNPLKQKAIDFYGMREMVES